MPKPIKRIYSWDFSGRGFRGWLKLGERRKENKWYVDERDGDMLRVPEEGQLPEWETLPEQDEGEL